MVRSPSAGIKPPFHPLKAQPSDLELVDSYLRTWVETGVKTGAFIHDFDVYAADPAFLTQQFMPAVASDGERAWYFYTPLHQKSVRGSRKTRTVANGVGSWHNEAKPKPLYMYPHLNVRRQIGFRRSFSFITKDNGVRVRTGWLMVELRLLKEGGAGRKPKASKEVEDALGNRVLCKVYRSPRNPEPSGAVAAAALLPGHKAEADDGETSDATLGGGGGGGDDDDSYDASLSLACGPKKKPDDVESSEATVAPPSRHSKANDEISGGASAAQGRKGKAEVDEGSAETSEAAAPHKRKARDEESSGVAAPRKKRADGSGAPGAPVSTAEMLCPQCGTHLVVTVKTAAESKSETENATGEKAPAASGDPQRGDSRGPSQKNVRFLQFL